MYRIWHTSWSIVHSNQSCQQNIENYCKADNFQTVIGMDMPKHSNRLKHQTSIERVLLETEDWHILIPLICLSQAEIGLHTYLIPSLSLSLSVHSFSTACLYIWGRGGAGMVWFNFIVYIKWIKYKFIKDFLCLQIHHVTKICFDWWKCSSYTLH